jgi:hypothetical protein
MIETKNTPILRMKAVRRVSRFVEAMDNIQWVYG